MHLLQEIPEKILCFLIISGEKNWAVPDLCSHKYTHTENTTK